MLGLLLGAWLAISPSGERITVVWDTPGEALHVETATGRVLGREPAPPKLKLTAPCREPFAVAPTPDGRLQIVACRLPDQSALAEHVAAKVCFLPEKPQHADCLLLPNGSTSVRGLAVSPDGRWTLVTHIVGRYTVHTTQIEQGWINTNAFTLLDVPARRLHATVLLDDADNGAANPWAVAFSPDSTTIYVAHAGTHELSIIDFPALLERIAASGEDPANQLSFLVNIRRRVQLPGKGPRALAVGPDGVWVAEYFSRTVTHISEAGMRTIRAGPGFPATPEGRGEMLFHDASLSFQRWQSCSSCHPDARVDGLNWDLLNDGIGNPKNTRSLVNSHRLPPAMWTGVRPNAESAVRSGMRHIQFLEQPEEAARAIDAYLKSLKPLPGPVTDRAAVERGRKLFFSAEVGCSACHPLPLYTDNKLHDVGAHGKFDFTTDANGQRIPQTKFKTASLLEVWRTAPYLHDGRYATIRAVLTEGNQGDRRGRTSHLSSRQIDDLVAFVLSLPDASAE